MTEAGNLLKADNLSDSRRIGIRVIGKMCFVFFATVFTTFASFTNNVDRRLLRYDGSAEHAQYSSDKEKRDNKNEYGDLDYIANGERRELIFNKQFADKIQALYAEVKRSFGNIFTLNISSQPSTFPTESPTVSNTPIPSLPPSVDPSLPPTHIETLKPSSTPTDPPSSADVFIFNSAGIMTVPTPPVTNVIFSSPTASDFFGFATSLSTSRIAISSPFHNDPFEKSVGLVQVYEMQNETHWVQIGENIVGEENEQAGYSLALSSSGESLVIGYPGSFSTSLGRVGIFQYLGGTWKIQVLIEGNTIGDRFGLSVDISEDGKRIAVGAEGYVKMYGLDGSNIWNQLGSDILGDLWAEVSVSGDHVAVGFWMEGVDRENSLEGIVRILKLNSTDKKWVLVGQMNGEGKGDYFGASISLSMNGTRIAAAAWGGNYAVVYEYNYSQNDWILLGQKIDGDQSKVHSVAISDARMVIGFHGYSSQQKAQVYDLVRNQWVAVKEDLLTPKTDDWTGWDVSMSPDGNLVGVGSPKTKGYNELSNGYVCVSTVL